jgi:hypothetical protein
MESRVECVLDFTSTLGCREPWSALLGSYES